MLITKIDVLLPLDYSNIFKYRLKNSPDILFSGTILSI